MFLKKSLQKKVFLPLVPRAKFPPPLQPSIPPEVLLPFVAQLMQQKILSKYYDNTLEDLVAEMHADSDFVFFMSNCQVEWAIDNCFRTQEIERVEFRFAKQFIDTYYSDEIGVKLAVEIIKMLMQYVIDNIESAKHYQDGHLTSWFSIPDTNRNSDSFGATCAVVHVHSIHTYLFITVAEAESEIRDADPLRRLMALRENFLTHIKTLFR